MRNKGKAYAVRETWVRRNVYETWVRRMLYERPFRDQAGLLWGRELALSDAVQALPQSLRGPRRKQLRLACSIVNRKQIWRENTIPSKPSHVNSPHKSIIVLELHRVKSRQARFRLVGG